MELSKDLLIDKTDLILREAEKLGISQAEVTITQTTSALTRLANSIIDQNVSEKHLEITIIVYYGKKKGSVCIEVLEPELLKQAVVRAAKTAKITPENSDFVSLPKAKLYSTKLDPSTLFSKKALEVTPEQRAEYAQLVIDEAHGVDKRIKKVAGLISNTLQEKLIKNSLGVNAYALRTESKIDLTVLGNDGQEETAGWSSDTRRDISDLRLVKVAQRAAQKAVNGFGAKTIDPGNYEVILEPAAVGGLMRMMTYYGFSARMYQEYKSFLKDKIGEKLFSEKLDLWSDPLDSRGVFASVFDGEGVPTRKLDLIDKGVVKALVYDTLTAAKDGVESTGHNFKHWRMLTLGMGESMPRANHLFVREGDSTLEEMISETTNGILITHFHYQNPVNPAKGVFTGLTRDGTWFVKDGEIKYALKTLRYTDSFTKFFNTIDLIGKYQELQDGYEWVSQGMFPPMKLPSFKFTGSTKM